MRKSHGHGGGAAAQRERREARHPHVRIEDLTDTGRLMKLADLFCAAGLMGRSQAELLWFVGAAEHALRVAEKNPCGLFVVTVRDKAQRVLWVTQADEDAAARRIKAWMEGA